MHGVEYLNSENEETVSGRRRRMQSKYLRQKLTETVLTFLGKIQAVFLYLLRSIHQHLRLDRKYTENARIQVLNFVI